MIFNNTKLKKIFKYKKLLTNYFINNNKNPQYETGGSYDLFQGIKNRFKREF
jgi:hypothetical protein